MCKTCNKKENLKGVDEIITSKKSFDCENNTKLQSEQNDGFAQNLFEFEDVVVQQPVKRKYASNELAQDKGKRVKLKQKIEKISKRNAKNNGGLCGLVTRKKVGEKTIEALFSNKEERVKFVAFIKTLLCNQGTLPNIIKIVDSVITSRAMSGFDINSSTLNEMEKVIDMSERKLRLLVLQGEIESMLACLDEQEKKLASLKFSKNVSVQKLVQKFDMPVRCLYRKMNSIVNKICVFLIGKGETFESLMKKISSEPWLVAYFDGMYEKQCVDEARKAKRKK